MTPASRNDGLPFRFTSRFSDQTTSADVSGVPSAKWTFRFSWKVKTFALGARLVRRDEQRDRVRQVVALVGEERVVDRVIDQRRGRVERAARVGGLDRERVVDDERRRRRACGGADGDEHRCGHDGRRQRREQRCPPTAKSFHSSCSLWSRFRGLRRYWTSAPADKSGAFGTRASSARLEPAGRARASGHELRLLDAAAGERVRAAGVEAAAARRLPGIGHLARQRVGQEAAPVRVRDRVDQRLAVGVERLLPHPAPSARSRPCGRGTSPRPRRRRGGRSPGRARSGAARGRARARG